MKLRIMVVSVILLVSIVVGSLSASAAAGKFGGSLSSGPLYDVITAANTYKGTSGLTKLQLAAIMLAPTWPETVSETTRAYAPAPMVVGRADIDKDLYYNADNSSTRAYKRIFFSSGIGVFQLDSKGMGTNLAMYEAINTVSASNLDASKIVERYNTYKSSLSGAALRAKVWEPWYGCKRNTASSVSGNWCEDNYQAIYKAASGSTAESLDIEGDATVTSLGGLVKKTCSYTAPTGGSYSYACYRWDPAVAQGYKGSWSGSVDGTSSANPLPYPMYSMKIANGTSYWDERHWFKTDTGYATDFYVYRAFGTIPQDTGVLYWKNYSYITKIQ